MLRVDVPLVERVVLHFNPVLLLLRPPLALPPHGHRHVQHERELGDGGGSIDQPSI